MSLQIRRKDPIEELFNVRRNFEEVFDRLLTGGAMTEGRTTTSGFLPPVDSWLDRDEKKYHLRIAVPGVDPKQLDVTLEGNRLRISGEMKSSEETKNADYWLREFSAGSFERVVMLPDGIDAEKLNAEYKNGILHISAPVDGSSLPRKIEVKAPSKTDART